MATDKKPKAVRGWSVVQDGRDLFGCQVFPTKKLAQEFIANEGVSFCKPIRVTISPL